MITTIITVGNSKGIRIPKFMLTESGLEKDVELKVKKGEIRIVAVKPKVKKSWNKEYMVSLGALGDWNRPEEDEAWAHLQ